MRREKLCDLVTSLQALFEGIAALDPVYRHIKGARMNGYG